MGSSVSKEIQQNFEKQIEFQKNLQRIQLERQMVTQELFQRRMAAMEIARSRDLAYYCMVAAGFLAVGCGILAFRKKNIYYLAPVAPAIFAGEYYFNIGFDNRCFDYQEIAGTLLAAQSDSFGFPITFDEIESRRNEANIRKKEAFDL